MSFLDSVIYYIKIHSRRCSLTVRVYVGRLLELDYLVGAVANPKRPFVMGGGMIFTFYKAQGHKVGSSLVEEDKLDLATSLLEKAKANGVSLLLPTDVVIADKFAPDANTETVAATAIPDGWMGLDIGPDSIKTFSDALDTTKTVIWNGPMGVFEFSKFAAGTTAIAKKLADLSGKGVTTIIGGGGLCCCSRASWTC